MKRMYETHPVLSRLLTDICITGVMLVIFALFHHVLPRQQESVGIVIPNPYATGGSAVEEITEVNPAMAATLIADTAITSGISYDGTLIAASKRNGGATVPSGKGGSAMESGEATGEETDTTPLAQKFADKYTDTVVETENSYTSPNISITVTEEETANGRITYYMADIYLRDVTSFQTAMAGNKYGSGFRDSITDMALMNSALVAINGDYYGNTTEGVVIRNGVIYRANPTDCDVCVLYYDGSMRVMAGADFDMYEAIADGAWQAWTFGPSLLDGEGNAISEFSSTRRIISANPRTAIGYYEPGHYCMIVVDGRGDSAGITLPQLSALFEELGCRAAYNLDGGNSSIMVWNDAIINTPSGGGRESSDALLIREVSESGL